MKKILPLFILSLWTMLPMMAIDMNVGETKDLDLGYVAYFKGAIWTISRPNDVVFTQTPQNYTTKVTIKAVKAFPASSPCVVQCTYYYYDLDPTKHTYTYLRSGYKSWTIFVGESGNSDDGDDVGITSIRLPEIMEMVVNTKEQLIPTIRPYGAQDNLKWYSSNTKVAQVFESGLVQALKEGEADITVRTSNGLSATCHVSVIYAQVVPQSIYITPYQNMKLGEKGELYLFIKPDNAFNNYTWHIEDPDIVDVQKGKYSLALEAKKLGSTTLTVTSVNGLTSSCRITVWPIDYDVELQPALDLDLGLSVKWASNNIGAYYENEPGHYFLWGYTDSSIDTGTEPSLSNISKKISYDAAQAKWGYGWRIPTESEMYELKNKCTWTWMENNGINGYKVVGPNGNSIFLPCTGYWNRMYIMNEKDIGYYWSANKRTYLILTEYYPRQDILTTDSYLNVSLPIRPVINYNETAIEDVSTDVQSTVKEYYTIDGKKVTESQLTKGFYIIRYSNGTTKKMYVK